MVKSLVLRTQGALFDSNLHILEAKHSCIGYFLALDKKGSASYDGGATGQ
jgi:hypothetical protein